MVSIFTCLLLRTVSNVYLSGKVATGVATMVDKENKLTAPLIAIALTYIGNHVLSAFYPICRLVKNICPEAPTYDTAITCPCVCVYFASVGDSLMVVNSAVNLVIYFSFRRYIQRLCNCRCNRIQPVDSLNK